MTKKIWRKNFEIKETDYQLAQAQENFYFYMDVIENKKYLKECIWVFKNGDNIGTYFVKEQLRGLIYNTLHNILQKTKKISGIHKKTIYYNDEYFSEAEKSLYKNLKALTDKKLIKIYKKLFKLYQMSHGTSLATTWFIDADGEDFTNYLMDFTKKKVLERKLRLSFVGVFSVLTSPHKESLVQKEEKESLRILDIIKSNKKAKKLFSEKDIKKIEKGLYGINPKIKNKILHHYKKWQWLPYTYIGPAYDLDHYLENWSLLLRQKISPKREINKLAKALQNTKKKRNELFKKLKLNKKEREIFDIAAQIVWLKAYRKDVLYHGFYVFDKILKELGKRHCLSLMQMKFFLRDEMDDLGKLDPNELNQRKKFSVLYMKDGKLKIMTGRNAHMFLSKQNFEREKKINTSKLKGTPACPGKASGKVKIINLPKEMDKMKVGDIMVAHTTFPALVPAMKKAAAIVTDDGGLTCHAAIVARELKIPCVVGTKAATKILKDGNKISIDATKGIIKKL